MPTEAPLRAFFLHYVGSTVPNTACSLGLDGDSGVLIELTNTSCSQVGDFWYHIAIDARVDKIDAFGFDCDSNCRNCDIQMSGSEGYDICFHSAKQSGIILNVEEPCLGYAGRGHGVTKNGYTVLEFSDASCNATGVAVATSYGASGKCSPGPLVSAILTLQGENTKEPYFTGGLNCEKKDCSDCEIFIDPSSHALPEGVCTTVMDTMNQTHYIMAVRSSLLPDCANEPPEPIQNVKLMYYTGSVPNKECNLGQPGDSVVIMDLKETPGGQESGFYYYLDVDSHGTSISSFGFDCDSTWKNCQLSLSAGYAMFDSCFHTLGTTSGMLLKETDPCIGYNTKERGLSPNGYTVIEYGQEGCFDESAAAVATSYGAAGTCTKGPLQYADLQFTTITDGLYVSGEYNCDFANCTSCEASIPFGTEVPEGTCSSVIKADKTVAFIKVFKSVDLPNCAIAPASTAKKSNVIAIAAPIGIGAVLLIVGIIFFVRSKANSHKYRPIDQP